MTLAAGDSLVQELELGNSGPGILDWMHDQNRGVIELREFLATGPSEASLRSAAIDPAGAYAYFAVSNLPGRLIKLDLELFEVVEAISTGADFRAVGSALLDQSGGLGWFGTDNSPGHILKAELHAECSLPDWIQVGTANGSVGALDSELVEVSLLAEGLMPGEYQARICLASNDPTQPVTTVPVALIVEPADLPAVLSVEPAWHDFGAVDVGGSASLMVTVANSAEPGGDALTLEAPVLSGDDVFVVMESSDCVSGLVLAAQQECSLTVQFAPIAEQGSSGQLVVSSEDGQQADVELQGAGVERPDLLFQDRFDTVP